jgi:isochorismate synthase
MDTDPLSLWAAFPAGPSSFFEDSDETIVGSGICFHVDQAAGTADRLTRLCDATGISDTSCDSMPRLLGALPFAPEWSDQRWISLTNQGFVLPRWTILRTSDRMILQLAIDGPIEEESMAETLAECARLATVLGEAPTRQGAWVGPRPADIPPGQDEETWREAVDSALRVIDEGGIEKVVLSRHVTHDFADDIDAAALLRQLSDSDAGRYRFGLQNGGTAFVGASPECLFDKRGSVLRVEALAGTYDMGTDVSAAGLIRASEHLFASGKDLEEHALVVCGITDALTPLCESVTAADWPEVREARGLAHLSSLIHAELSPGVSAFDLIDVLHPTPAVGGLPVSAAMDFIRETEKAPRGLFAAPIGWISADGDACLAVAIRSALLRGRQADVYAGAGIVTGSDPEAEWTETGAKLRWLSEIGSGGRP